MRLTKLTFFSILCFSIAVLGGFGVGCNGSTPFTLSYFDDFDTDGDGVPDSFDTTGDGEPDADASGNPIAPDFSDPTAGGSSPPVVPDPVDPIPDTGIDLGGTAQHFDVDAFLLRPGSDWLTTELCHVHRFDEEPPHLSVIDFLAGCKYEDDEVTIKKPFGFTDVAPNDPNQMDAALDRPECDGAAQVLYRIENADKASGAIEIILSDGTRKITVGDPNFADALGATEIDWFTHAGSLSVTSFKLQPNDLSMLVGAKPGDVQSDSDNRCGSFRIKLYCDGVYVWDFATYEHRDVTCGT